MPADAQHLSIAIIGAGFGGLETAIRLRQSGRDDFVVFEKSAGVGGTWWVNRYPGCACDVPSQLYSLSFAPNPDWTRHYAPRSEIQAYLEGLVAEHGLAGQIRLETEITRAEWHEGDRRWVLTDQHGRRYTARVLVSALGGLSRPAWPDLPGLDEFTGQVVHSQQWPDDLDLDGKRLAVVGTGASAAQFVPQVAKRAGYLTVFQRTPAWIIPRRDRPIGPIWRRLFRRVPLLQRLARFTIYARNELRVPALLRWHWLGAGHRWLANRHRRAQIEDPEISEKFRPNYDIGCKRVILSDDFYPTFNRDNVALVDRAVARVTESGVVDADGRHHPAEVLILATGFRATEPVPEGLFIGRDGCDLADRWRDGPAAYKGTTVHGFPNLFILLGPNTALGHSSVLLMIESQIRYLLSALDHLEAENGAFEVKQEAQTRWNNWVEQRLSRSVWNAGGCNSWYLHPRSGRNTTIWPGFVSDFRRRLRQFDRDAYQANASAQETADCADLRRLGK
ncbi:NAD(P)/FAD-dependent oxidoreductase [Wenzhouxiangella sp. XN201]|uniref:flavin-containing monooxygenase n=1 Tax=Wenzhouxiangella sp. XN201 TaxID=2710755 RepID=UPI0013C57C65|nr:NAD(P)/FAD-dependent oxidoreductase [Wenzhouxiangella sp. XN201]NEZ04167.1 NAD(P)/FAD-dependent oxidoreductase [Wenzhouxiangella sp. XN201]